MKLPPLPLFTLVLAVTLLADGMITVTVLWEGVRRGQTPLVFGAVLFLMNVIPFAAQALLAPLRRAIAEQPLRALSGCRLVGVPVALLGLTLSGQQGIVRLFLIAGALAAAVFLSQQCVETLMGRLVMEGRLAAGEAARISQTALQLGVFAGNALAGSLITFAGVPAVFAVIAGSLACGALLPLVGRGLLDGPPVVAAESGASADAATVPAAPGKASAGEANAGEANAGEANAGDGVRWLLVAAMGALAVQLSSYNFFVPLIMQKLHGMSAAQYGAISAAAGIGALLATLVPLPDRRTAVLVLAAAIVGGDAALAWASLPALAMAVSLPIGFGFNALRVAVRQRMFTRLHSRAQSALWAGRITVGFRATNAGMPLLMGGALSGAGAHIAPAAFVAFGSIAVALVLSALAVAR